MRVWQHEKQDPTKPTVCKYTGAGMWWAQVRDLEGRYYCDVFFTQQQALEQAYEYAAMNQAALALRNLEAAQ